MAAVVVGVGKIGAEYRGDLIVIAMGSDHCGLRRRVASRRLLGVRAGLVLVACS